MVPHSTSNPRAQRTRRYSFVDGSLVSDTTTNILGADYDNLTMSPYPNPGDKHKPTAFAYTATKYTNYQGNRKVTRVSDNKFHTQIDGCVLGSSVLTRVTVPDMLNYHYNKALAKLNDKVRGQLDLAVSVAEYHQLTQMVKGVGKIDTYLGNTLRGIDKVSMRSGKYRTLKGLVKDAGNNWLQWQYGIKPLLSDIYGAADEYFRHQIPNILTVTAKSYESIGVQRLSKLDPSEPVETIDVNGVQGVMFHLKFKDKGGFDAARWATLNPVSLAWELMPYSFVVDWVYNVGDFLRSYETSLLYGSSFVSGYYTQLRAWHPMHERRNFTYVGSGDRYVDNTKSMGGFTDFKRIVLGSYPGPRLPTFKVDLGTERYLSAASLLAQHLR